MFKSTPTDSHTKGTGTINSYPPHPSRQFYFIGRGKKRTYLKKEDGEEEEERKKTNKGNLESAPLLTWATAAAGQGKTAQL